MKSMTGYGASRLKVSNTELSIVVRSVNGRFFEPRFHLPKEYFEFEMLLKKKAASKINRGTVDIFIHREGPASLEIEPNIEAARKWLKAHQILSRTLRLEANPNLIMERLSALPHIFSIQDRHGVSGAEKSKFMRAFEQAINRCDAERIREGKSIKRHLEKILKELLTHVNQMEQLRQKVNKDFSQRLNSRLQKLGMEGQVDQARFAQELILYLDKGDIAEEIERLREHIKMCFEFLKTTEQKGKKLDFYSQELLREVNTIGSKANNAELTEQVVRAKALIESFKEQVQNVE